MESDADFRSMKFIILHIRGNAYFYVELTLT